MERFPKNMLQCPNVSGGALSLQGSRLGPQLAGPASGILVLWVSSSQSQFVCMFHGKQSLSESTMKLKILDEYFSLFPSSCTTPLSGSPVSQHQPWLNISDEGLSSFSEGSLKFCLEAWAAETGSSTLTATPLVSATLRQAGGNICGKEGMREKGGAGWGKEGETRGGRKRGRDNNGLYMA